MDEKDLVEIERRMNAYPLEAKRDIAALVSELRRLRQLPAGKAKADTPSHLYDPLTGLLNAGAYGVRFAMARARATRYRKLFAVMSLDFADTAFGPAPAEREGTLKDIAHRLEGCVRATDTLARVGDENFAIILEDLLQPDQAERVKQHVQEVLEQRPSAVDIRLQFYPGPPKPAHPLSS